MNSFEFLEQHRILSNTGRIRHRTTAISFYVRMLFHVSVYCTDVFHDRVRSFFHVLDGIGSILSFCFPVVVHVQAEAVHWGCCPIRLIEGCVILGCIDHMCVARNAHP